MRIPFMSARNGTDRETSGTQVSEKTDEALALRPKDGPPPAYDSSEENNRLQVHPIPAREAVLIKIQPPREPEKVVDHVGCDIVLVIDVSGSMGDAAPVPGDEGEETGLSVLDLVKHATSTIIQTCSEHDRVGIVTFSMEATVVMPLTEMTTAKKRKALGRVKQLRPTAATNLWSGIQEGLSLFERQMGTNVSSMMVLTDGMPNYMCPPQGYVPKLKTLMPFAPTIHTFGFGYNLRSGLLKSIAEIGGGNYGFIPDAGMIGTVFNHAVANLQSTYAMRAVLRLTYDSSLEIAETMGDHVNRAVPVQRKDGATDLTLPLGNLQYGQSRDVFLQVKNMPTSSDSSKASQATRIFAKIEYKVAHAVPSPAEPVLATFEVTADLSQASQLSETEIAFHESRAEMCDFVLSLFQLRSDLEWTKRNVPITQKQEEFEALVQAIPARGFAERDADNKALMEDLCGEEPHGQVRTALSKNDFLERWGLHYLLSYVNAHTRQICNSFKDQGPLRYGVDSPLFQRCLGHLDEQFNRLPPPKPSRQVYDRQTGHARFLSSSSVSISAYNSSSAPCFAGSTTVELATGRKLAIKRLRRGMRVQTPLGPRSVAFVLKTPVESATLCRVGPLLVTPWHPISPDGGKTWDFPANLAVSRVRYTGAVYSIMLQRDDARPAGHAILVGDSWGVTLGHGMTSTCEDDVRGHEFWGDWARVSKEMMRLGVSRGGIAVATGVERDEATGLVKALLNA